MQQKYSEFHLNMINIVWRFADAMKKLHRETQLLCFDGHTSIMEVEPYSSFY